MFALDTMPTISGKDASLPKSLQSANLKGLLLKVKFGPQLSIREECQEFEKLVLEFTELFVTQHVDLPTSSVEQHRIDLLDGVVLVRAKQR